MTLSAEEKKSFSTAYLQVLVKSWTNEAFAAQLRDNPRSALAEHGVELPANASIEIVEHPSGAVDAAAQNQAAMDAQVSLYESGLETGNFKFHVPGAPDLATETLDELDLAGISGGFEPCCCCCSC